MSERIQTAAEWIKELWDDSVQIIDDDGWRGDDGVRLDTPITESDFHNRFNISTTTMLPQRFWAKENATKGISDEEVKLAKAAKKSDLPQRKAKSKRVLKPQKEVDSPDENK